MRGKGHSLDGLPDFTPSSFYVPGERHENLPAGAFAGRGMGTPVQTLLPDTRAPEYATGGSGMFQGADFGSGGHGKILVMQRPGMGQDDDSDDSSGVDLSSLLTSVQQGAQTVQAVRNAVSSPQAAAAAPAATGVSAVAAGLMSKKIAGIPVVILLAGAGAAAFFILRKKK